MRRINENKLADVVTLAEGKKVSVNKAQVKEVMRCTFEALWQIGTVDGFSSVLELLERHGTQVL